MAATGKPRLVLTIFGHYRLSPASPAVADRPPASTRIFTAGFGESTRQRGDFEMARYACVALQQGHPFSCSTSTHSPPAATQARGGVSGLDADDRAKLQDAAVDLVCGAWGNAVRDDEGLTN